MEEFQVLYQEIQEVLVVELVVEVQVVQGLLVKETMEVILQAQMKELVEVDTRLLEETHQVLLKEELVEQEQILVPIFQEHLFQTVEFMQVVEEVEEIQQKVLEEQVVVELVNNREWLQLVEHVTLVVVVGGQVVDLDQVLVEQVAQEL